MSLRDWFAGMALPAVIKMNTELGMDNRCTAGEAEKLLNPKTIALSSYEIADAMLAVRKEQTK